MEYAGNLRGMGFLVFPYRQDPGLWILLATAAPGIAKGVGWVVYRKILVTICLDALLSSITSL